MIKRPKNLEFVEVSLLFNDREFSRLEIDLEHINKQQRSDFKSYEIYLILEKLISSEFILEKNDEKDFGNVNCSYYEKVGQLNEKCYKVVFCVCSDRPDTVGVITLYRIKGRFE